MKTLHRILARVGEVCVPGVGTWEPAWIHTRKANDAFDLAFEEWLQDDNGDARKKLVGTADEFVAAWQRASAMYEDTQVEGF